MTNATAVTCAPAQQGISRWARTVLLIAAVIELLGGLRDLPVLLGDTSQIPGPGLGGSVILAKIVLQPVLAFAALFFTIRGKIPYALVAMALIILLTWLSFVPSVQLHGLGLEGADAIAMVTLVWQIILAPVLALAIAALALMEKNLTLATVLAVLPTIVGILTVIAFGISVAIYGF